RDQLVLVDRAAHEERVADPAAPPPFGRPEQRRHLATGDARGHVGEPAAGAPDVDLLEAQDVGPECRARPAEHVEVDTAVRLQPVFDVERCRPHAKSVAHSCRAQHAHRHRVRRGAVVGTTNRASVKALHTTDGMPPVEPPPDRFARSVLAAVTTTAREFALIASPSWRHHCVTTQVAPRRWWTGCVPVCDAMAGRDRRGLRSSPWSWRSWAHSKSPGPRAASSY